jgi:hypothetical protein
MRKELQDKLFAKYPKIFADKDKSAAQTCMCWGICCGDGWYYLLDNLCGAIQHHIDNPRWIPKHPRLQKVFHFAYTHGWVFRKLFGRWYFNSKLLQFRPPTDAEKTPQLVADQVKEKFAGLRFYYHGGDEYTGAFVELTERLSYTLCEECGLPGKVYTDGWNRVLCDEHAKQQGRTRKEEDSE